MFSIGSSAVPRNSKPGKIHNVVGSPSLDQLLSKPDIKNSMWTPTMIELFTKSFASHMADWLFPEKIVLPLSTLY